MPFENLRKNIKKRFKSIFNDIKYGDEIRKPLAYIPTHTTNEPLLFTLPSEDMDLEPFKSTTLFPKLSLEILIHLFKSVGIKFVPEIALYYLKEKTPFEIFENFCLTFGLDEEGNIDAVRLNRVISYLQKMDSFRVKNRFDSREIYIALANNDFEKADKLIKERIKIDDKNAI